ncbi:NAD(P)H-dependent flavin oxidoreductase [Hespellia stercorisuis]|uniref:Probable nitronate monooxygenase n=1 Tax=Hespellia stercorisuis DSM 15480 TaxID=1121950 RepID=A0A1M6LD87_9FIRM|nr:nitronate monooxygenase family protein [Hespellia stercorisuis]SHJ69122.1 NAD(P)H-dependent flavin oxidoreductase YrpB, nitropropane dioxygenase family [Hespellia stercorisuis DSM 15480]
MKLSPLMIGDKSAAVPVIQGGMGVGISLGGLAGAVAAEGGVGIISTAQIGFREPDFETNRVLANERAIAAEFRKAREIAPEGIVGFNIMVALKDYKSHVKAAVDAGADLIISGAGLPTELPGLVAGSQTKIAPIVSTDKSAKVILKYWDRKFQRTADLVVIEGPKAGGHLGFSMEQLEEYDVPAYEAEIHKILETVAAYGEKYQCHVPVVIAGGIYDADDVQHALELGADGVQVATRFVTTTECDADENYKESYIQAKEEDIVIVKSPVGMPGRAILNPFMKRVKVEGKVSHSPCHGCLARCKPAEIPYCITDGLVNAAEGNVDQALLFCGAYAYRATRIETVREVMDSLTGR